MDAISRPVPGRPVVPLPRRLLRARSDERLVAMLRGGHADAFEAIYDRHHAQILAFCRHMLGSREDAEDAAQHTFIAAHRDLVGSTKKVELRPWLYAIARNRCLSMLRARREQSALDEDVADPGTEGLADVVQRRQDLRDLVGDLARLPDTQRAAIVLFELGDLSQAEIARVLGRNTAQVKALVFQARTTLMHYRDARDVTCRTIREELATARGPVLLRGRLRRHLRTCADCTVYAEQIKRQHADLSVLLPVIPTAGLKAATLAAVTGAGGAAGGGGLGVFALSGAKGLAAKGIAALALTGGAVGTTIAVVDHHHRHAKPAEAVSPSQPRVRPASTPDADVSFSPKPTPAAAAVGRRVSSRLRGARVRAKARSFVHPSSTAPKTPAASTPATPSSSSSGRPASTPVAGARRRSTGHASKPHPPHPAQAQGPKAVPHLKKAVPPGLAKKGLAAPPGKASGKASK